MSDVTHILQAIEQGDPHAASELLPLVYDELRRLAAAQMARERPGQTLDATALVHEAYLRLVGSPVAPAPGSPEPEFANRRHFFAAAAEAMRRILVENARRKASLKRGGGLERQELPESDLAAPEPSLDLLALDEALTQLGTTDALAAELVQLRYFAGLTSAQAAEALGISTRKAERIWTYARSWLFTRLQSD
jgi:RNA polymerase sigma factor (TIGR02999 family)